MQNETLRLQGDKLQNLRDIALIRGENPLLCEFVAYNPSLGVVSAMLLNVDEDPLEVVAQRIDEAAAQADSAFGDLLDALDYPVTMTPVADQLVVPALTGRAQGVAEYTEAEMELLQAVVVEALPLESRAIFRCLEDLAEGRTFRTLGFLTSGDVEARRQALETYPIAADKIVDTPHLHEAIDARSELSPLLAEALGLSQAEFRIYTRFERTMAAMSFDADNPIGSVKPKSEILTRISGRQVPTMGSIRKTAIIAAKRLRIDQIPDGSDVAADAGVLSVLKCIGTAMTMEERLNVGPGPFERMIARIRPDSWDDATDYLLRSRDRLANVGDYLRNTAKSIGVAVLVDKLRQEDGIDMDRLSATAHQVLSDEMPDADDAAYLGAFTSSTSTIAYRLANLETTVRQAIGAHASIKSICEVDTRWHHIHERIGNEMKATSQALTWEPLQGLVELGDVVARELYGSDQLIEQGRRENHCVGSYARHVLEARPGSLDLIFSIEDPEGQILSTVEMRGVNAQGSTFDWRIGEHKARSNHAPCVAARKAAEQLKEHLEDLPEETVHAYIRSIHQDPANLKEQLARMINAFGANICDPDLPERTLEVISSTLPKQLRGKDVSEWTRLFDPLEGVGCISYIDSVVAAARASAGRERAPQALEM